MRIFSRRHKKPLPDTEPHCFFCSRAQSEVARLIAARSVEHPDPAFICNECIDICVEIITADRDRDEHASLSLRRCVCCQRVPDLEAGITVTAALVCSECREAQP